jgi:hypothetical protein
MRSRLVFPGYEEPVLKSITHCNVKCHCTQYYQIQLRSRIPPVPFGCLSIRFAGSASRSCALVSRAISLTDDLTRPRRLLSRRNKAACGAHRTPGRRQKKTRARMAFETAAPDSQIKCSGGRWCNVTMPGLDVPPAVTCWASRQEATTREIVNLHAARYK